MNDNGGTQGVKVYNAGMRGQKGTAWLGGTRAASFWRWPGALKPADVKQLCSNIDFFPTIAELAGSTLSDDAQRQVEGRSLVPLLVDPNAAWDERTLVTHVGRWPHGQMADWKYKMCSVRNSRWHLVSDGKKPGRHWQLFDLSHDYGEQTDVSAQHPELVASLDAYYDHWWQSILPMQVNENAVGPAENPFKVMYRRQFGAEN
jgi:arylsulfatase